MIILLVIFWLLSIAYIVVLYASMLYAILYAFGKFELIREDNGFYVAMMAYLHKIVGPLLSLVRRVITFSDPYDFSPFVLFLILYILPASMVQVVAIAGMNVAPFLTH